MEKYLCEFMMSLIRSQICGDQASVIEKKPAEEEITEMCRFSSKHDLLHLLVLGLKQNNIVPNESFDLDKYILKALYRYEKLNYEYDNLCSTLECAKIPFLPLKGSIMRRYYPEPWMRTSCDIDILIHEQDAEKAKSILVSEHNYTYHGKGSHDLSFFTPANVHIELHYDLVEDGVANKSSEVLKSVWDTAVLQEKSEYHYEMPDEMFYFYHIAHMAKHFEGGGCGIRPFIDLWLLDNLDTADCRRRNELLEQGDLLKFANSARKLSRVWFGGEEHDSVSEQIQEYIFTGGVYGNSQNRIAVQQQKKGGRIKYALSKIFIPYDVIKFHYPVLQKHRYLTPFMQVRRWCKLIFCGHLKRSVKELKYNNSITDTEAKNIQNFLYSIGL